MSLRGQQQKMSNVVQLPTAGLAPAYRFDMFQSETNGLVAIDAIVPQWVADRMLALLDTI